MVSILETLFGNIVDRKRLGIYNEQFCWNLQVDILVFSELALNQLDYIGQCVRSAFIDL